MVLRRTAAVLLPILLLVLFAACRAEPLEALQLPAVDQLGPTATPLPNPVPERVLSICLGEEPRSLFIYGDLSRSARIIRQAIYDGPIDRVNDQQTAILLQEMPSQENGLVRVEKVEVLPGERMVDAWGNITFLASGVTYRPAGCMDQDCWRTFTQEDSIDLDQVEIRYRLRTDITWSDGNPLTAADSVFSYQAASMVYGDAGPVQLRFTQSYQLEEDGGDLIWRGLPGYQGLFSYGDFFFEPLPQHRLGNFSREELLTAPQSNIQPLGWGAYQVQEWVAGDHITLVPNPNYHLSGEGLPAFDALVFRFVEGGEEALAALQSGECQIAANVPDLPRFQSQLTAAREKGKLNIYAVEGLAWEQVSFGINHLDSAVSPLQDVQLRQALISCVDREELARARLDAGPVADGFWVPDSQEQEPEKAVIPYQPTEAELELKELGWIDGDGDPSTPRQADGVEGISPGTPLSFTLLAGDSQKNSLALDYIKEGLENCGVGVELNFLPAADLLAPGPEGPIFGRSFDLAYFAWAAGRYHPCRLFVSQEIPGPYPAFPKGWGGVNAPGYSNQEFDSACLIVSTNLPDSTLAQEAEQELEDIFKAETPILPLFFRRDLVIASPDISGLENTWGDEFWNIERLE